jgi:hypothetical protein
MQASLVNSDQKIFFKTCSKILDLFNQSFRTLLQDRKFFLMQNFARFIVVRDWGYRLQSKFNPPAEVLAASQIKLDLRPEGLIKTIYEQGYCKGISLQPERVRDLLSFAYAHPCYGNRNKTYPVVVDSRSAADQEFVGIYRIASYLEHQETCEAIQSLRYDPLVLEIAQAYLNCPPVYHNCELLWSFPALEKGGTIATQSFHHDLNDYRSIKFFFYLTDVSAATDGPHVYIRGTHRCRKFLHQLLPQRYFGDQVFVNTYGEGNCIPVYGSAGTGFIGDPYCLHKGSLPQSRGRLMLQLEFRTHNYQATYPWHRSQKLPQR